MVSLLARISQDAAMKRQDACAAMLKQMIHLIEITSASP